MHYIKVNVRRDELTEMAVHVPAWEIPLLEAKHGEANLTIGEAVEFKNRPWPTDARSEMARLGQLYGRTGAGDNDPSVAERLYGPGSVGIKALQKAMDTERKGYEPKKGEKSEAASLVG